MAATYFILAGESSGDLHGSALMREMLIRAPGTRFIGIGGPRMIAQGFKSLYPMEDMAIMGFSEVIRRLPFLIEVRRRVVDTIMEIQPEKIILIDYPGFNLRLACYLKKCSSRPIVYYISPQIWAWKEERIRIIRQCVDQMLVIFPFEKEWYNERGVHVEFVGHPFFDSWKPRARNVLAQAIGCNADQPILTLYPGSRLQELNRHLPLFSEVARRLRQSHPDIQVLLGLGHAFNREQIIKEFSVQDFLIIDQDPQAALEIADAALVASGTATLEAALYGTPMAVIYIMSSISWWISRHLVKVPFASIVNIILKREVVPEFLQTAAQIENILPMIEKLLFNDRMRQETLTEFIQLRHALGDDGASARAAELVLQE